LYANVSVTDQDLEFNQGDTLFIIETPSGGTWKGECNGAVGVFPSNFVEVTLDNIPISNMPIKPDSPTPVTKSIPIKNQTNQGSPKGSPTPQLGPPPQNLPPPPPLKTTGNASPQPLKVSTGNPPLKVPPGNASPQPLKSSTGGSPVKNTATAAVTPPPQLFKSAAATAAALKKSGNASRPKSVEIPTTENPTIVQPPPTQPVKPSKGTLERPKSVELVSPFAGQNQPLKTAVEAPKKTYPYEVLKNHRTRPKDVDSSVLEKYIADEEFISVFGVNRAEFEKMPAWKQSNLKSQKLLF